MQGDIRVSSEVGAGSTFEFTVALGAVQTSDADVTRLLVQLAGMRALVIGAEGANRGAVGGVLRGVGVVVDEVEHAEAALQALRSKSPRYAVVVIDSFLPGPGGFGLARRIRAIPELRHLKLVMLTSAGQRGDATLCREIGVSAYLTKPLSRPELLEALVAVLADDAMVDGGGAASLVTKHSIQEVRQRLEVLLAEDNPVNHTAAATMLRRRGHRVDVVETGPDAADALLAKRYHVVLLDIQLPGKQGSEVLAELRSHPHLAGVPVVAMTARVGDGERARYLSQGFNAFLAKPFRPHELFAAVEGWGIAEDESHDSPTGQTQSVPVDVAALTETMTEAGIAESISTLLYVFSQDAPQRMEQLEAAVRSRDGAAIEASAHVFRSAAATVMARPLEAALSELESAGSSEDLGDTELLLRRAHQEFELVRAFLDGIGNQSFVGSTT
jgi:two-component system, sensor histidine kinase and response regulator